MKNRKAILIELNEQQMDALDEYADALQNASEFGKRGFRQDVIRSLLKKLASSGITREDFVRGDYEIAPIGS